MEYFTVKRPVLAAFNPELLPVYGLAESLRRKPSKEFMDAPLKIHNTFANN